MRRECISEETLMDYIEGRLSEKERSKTEQHLAGCDICLEELSVAGKMIRDDCVFDSTRAELDVLWDTTSNPRNLLTPSEYAQQR